MLRLPRTLNSSTIRAFSQQTNASLKFTQNRKFSSVFQKANNQTLFNPVKQVVAPKPLGASKIVALATLSSATAPLVFKKPAQCQAVYVQPDSIKDIVNESGIKYQDKPIFHKGELTFGTFLGLCTGYLVKKVGKIFALFVGTGFVFLQYLSQQGYVTVHWDRLQGGYSKALDTDRDGKVTKRDLHTKWGSFTGFLTNNLQFKSTFLIGFYAGIRYG